MAYRAHIYKRPKVKLPEGVERPKPKKRLKYRNVRVQLDGIWFDSRKEAFVYMQLKSQQQAGKVKEIEVHPRFPFPCGTRFTADFRVTYADGLVEVLDVKSEITRKNTAYRIRIKMLRYYYPDVEFREV